MEFLIRHDVLLEWRPSKSTVIHNRPTHSLRILAPFLVSILMLLRKKGLSCLCQLQVLFVSVIEK